MGERTFDADDVASARRGDPDAWRRLVAAHQGLLRHVCSSFRLGHHDGAEVIQNTWLKCWEHLPQLRDDESFSFWIATIARRECIRYLRGAVQVQPFDPLTPMWERGISVSPDVADEVVARETLRELSTAITHLPRRQRDVIEALRRDPVSYQSVAEELGVPIGSLGPTRARALARLREDPMLAATGT